MRINHRIGLGVVGLCSLAIVLAACSTTAATKPPSSSTTSSSTTTTIGPSLPGGAAPSAAALIAAIRSAVGGEAGVHVLGVNTTTKTRVVQNFVEDLGIRTGDEQLSSAGARLEIRVAIARAYLFGNASGLTTFFGAPASVAQNAGMNWFYAASGSAEYTQFKKSLSVSSFYSSYLPSKQAVTVTKGVLNGVAVYVLAWKQTPDAVGIAVTLDVPVKGTPLPLAEGGISTTATQQTTFSKWGETVVVAIPSPAVPIAMLFG